MTGMPGILDQDLDSVLDRTRSIWTDLDGARLLLTGATGFVGTHMLESVRHARERAATDLRVVAPARDPGAFRARLPWTKDAAWLEVVQGDVHRFKPAAGTIDFVIHSANTASPKEIADDPSAVARMVVDGSSRVYGLAAAAGARRVLQLSSGSVYGTHFAPAKPISEDDPGAPEGKSPAERLARAKRDAESAMLAASEKPNAPSVVFARGFALCGPWLPLDAAFAFGNFLGAAMRDEAVIVSGDGTPVRSYLYSGDMVAWLWAMLMRGAPGRAYNLGSEHDISIGDLAHRIAALVGGTVEILGDVQPGSRAHWHVPDTSRARRELGVAETVPLNDAIVRSAEWWIQRGALRRAR
ncbi:MAG TPA: NAD-dependent epimerase/dehydratase family protein [Gemmatimonadaceae bacterium]|nr:NAD-dependent epimerase/dehydratase family protein [Gemmatimonadaceae bacterium]